MIIVFEESAQALLTNDFLYLAGISRCWRLAILGERHVADSLMGTGLVKGH